MANIPQKGNVNKDQDELIKSNIMNNCPACGPGTNPLQTPYPGYPCINYKYYPTYMYVSQYAYPEALRLIVQSVSGEREDELFYNYMINIAPPEQKEIVVSIRDDEIKHNKMLRELYWQLTGQEIPVTQNDTFQPPSSYCDGIKKALFGELAAVERYRKILFGLEFLPYRNMITEIYTDELKHGSKWNYLYTVNCSCYMPQADKGNHSLQMKITLEQLARFNGQNGRPAYVAVNGIVYDVTNIPNWQGGQHFGLQAGKDMTAQFASCHPNQYTILNSLPRVGVLI